MTGEAATSNNELRAYLCEESTSFWDYLKLEAEA